MVSVRPRTGRAVGLRQRTSLLSSVMHDEGVLVHRIREGRFQRALAVVTAMAALLSGGEVAYEHYRGSYSQQIMYSPTILSVALALAGFVSTINRRVAKTVLPLISLVVVLDGFVGFIFHVRGIARKPGGWRVPVMNLTMGPPIFAPLLFGLSGYLGLVTSFLRRADDPPDTGTALPQLGLREDKGWQSMIPKGLDREGIVMSHHIREGQFQRNIALVAGLSAILSGLEASYSHYQNNFRYPKLQWSPLLIAPALGIAGISSVWSRTAARTILPLFSVIALLDGMIGSFFHLRGILRMPGGIKLPLYNLIYGPPIFAPMLFAASGFMGLLASLLRRPK